MPKESAANHDPEHECGNDRNDEAGTGHRISSAPAPSAGACAQD